MINGVYTICAAEEARPLITFVHPGTSCPPSYIGFEYTHVNIGLTLPQYRDLKFVPLAREIKRVSNIRFERFEDLRSQFKLDIA